MTLCLTPQLAGNWIPILTDGGNSLAAGGKRLQPVPVWDCSRTTPWHQVPSLSLKHQSSHFLSRVQAIAWSPATSLVVAPKTLQFATSGTDHKLRLFTSDLNDVKVCSLFTIVFTICVNFNFVKGFWFTNCGLPCYVGGGHISLWHPCSLAG